MPLINKVFKRVKGFREKYILDIPDDKRDEFIKDLFEVIKGSASDVLADSIVKMAEREHEGRS